MIISDRPWKHLYIDDFMPDYMLQYHYNKAQQVDPQGDVGRLILDYDPMHRVADLLEHFPNHRPYNKLGKFIHYAATAANLTHAVHTDAPFKILSAVLYLGPTDNYGTRLYDQTKFDKEVEWKPNRLVVFAGNDYTWHDYRSKQVRFTLNYFLVDPDVIENQQYKQGIIM